MWFGVCGLGSKWKTNNEQWISDYSYNSGTELTDWSRRTHHWCHIHTLHIDSAHNVLSRIGEMATYMHERLKSFSDVMPQVYMQVVVMLLPSLVQPTFLHQLRWNMTMALHLAFSSQEALYTHLLGFFLCWQHPQFFHVS